MDLPLYGPDGNELMPATVSFVKQLFAAPDGAYHYLSDYLSGGEAYRLLPHNVSTGNHEVQHVLKNDDYSVSAVSVHHGPIPALAWRIDIDGRAVVFSGDMNGDYHTLPLMAEKANLLVAHHAIPEAATGVARNLHMPPSVIGEIAGSAEVGQLLLSHRMVRTLGHEAESMTEIRKHYSGPVMFAEDGMCVDVGD
jgi:ribonuclease BN (tRNA processing enzyme)